MRARPRHVFGQTGLVAICRVVPGHVFVFRFSLKTSFVFDRLAALRGSRSPFDEMISFGVIMGPCFVLESPSALILGAVRSSRSPFGEIISFGVILSQLVGCC